jgi:hypothetical protein
VWWYTIIVAAALSGSTAGAQDWADFRQQGDFQIRANFPLEQVPELLPELARLERDVTHSLRIVRSGQPVHVLLFHDRKSYNDYLQSYFHGAPARRAMFIKGSQPGWVMAYVNDQFEIDLRHETTHALLHSRLPSVPLWLDEGLAEYFEVRGEQRLYDNPHRGPTRTAARFYRIPDLRELEGLSDIRQMGRAEYRGAWAWVHFMLHGPPPAHRTLMLYLQEIASGGRPGPLHERLEQAFPDLKTAFRTHHLRRSE